MQKLKTQSRLYQNLRHLEFDAVCFRDATVSEKIKSITSLLSTEELTSLEV
jgi:hypothetical protein